MLKIIKLNSQIIYKAYLALPKDYIKTFENKLNFSESLVGRYEIFACSNQKIKIDNTGKPIFENGLFWSISHKENLVFVGTSNHPIGIDIEIIKSRGREVFSLHSKGEYDLFGGENLENFYRIWTIKESVTKLNLSGIDDISYVKIEKLEKISNKFDDIEFDLKIYGSFKNKEFKAYNGIKNNLSYSYSF